MSDNLSIPRLAQDQANPHTTNQNQIEQLDGLLSDGVTVSVDNSNAASITSSNLENDFRFVLSAGSPAPTAAITITVAGSVERGAILVRNDTDYDATVEIASQTAPSPVVRAGQQSLIDVDGSNCRTVSSNKFDLIVAVGDESTALTTGTAKVTFRLPAAVYLTDVRANVNTAPTGATITVDINVTASTILSTKLTIDASEKTSVTAATPPVLSSNEFADDAEVTVDIDQVGSTVAGAGLKVHLSGFYV